MPGQLEDSDDPKEFDDSEQSKELSNSHDLSRALAAWIVFSLVGGVRSGLGSEVRLGEEELISRNNGRSDNYQQSNPLSLPVEYQADVVRQNRYEVDDVHQLGHKF